MIMFINYWILTSDQEEQLRYESLKLEIFRYVIITLTCIGVFRIYIWLRYIALRIYLELKTFKAFHKENSRKIPVDVKKAHKNVAFTNNSNNMASERFVDFKNMKIPDSPSPESIMGIAAAAATAATVFMDKKRNSEWEGRCEKCCKC